MISKENTDFVNIVTFFESPEERDIETLSKIYEDHNKMREGIISILDPDFLNNIHNKSILIKPNWVRHSLTKTDEICLRTNDNLLVAVLEIILTKSPKYIVIGDAPIQISHWDGIVSEKLFNKISELSKQYNIPIHIRDFRRVTFNPEKNEITQDRKSLNEYVIFNTGEKSYLEPISKKRKSGFRVTNYDPDRLAESHNLGTHKYCITKELFEVDIVLSIPKIKTHEKTAITGALKNLVGVNGDKDYLPHHRVGGTGFGGDCYPGKSVLRRLSEYFRDKANRKQGKRNYRLWILASDIFWIISRPQNVHQIAAAWYGNDTTWRMVMDLNIVAEFGTKDGKLYEKPQRKIYSLTDGIIAGQGNGPLYPDPLPLGCLSFSNNNALNDTCMAVLMNFDENKIPLLLNARKSFVSNKTRITINRKEVNERALTEYSIKTKPPIGWIGYF